MGGIQRQRTPPPHLNERPADGRAPLGEHGQTIAPAAALWCNLLHLHGQDIYFDLAREFSFPIVNWHDRETPPSLSEAQTRFGGVVCGGVSQNTLVYRSPDEVRQEAAEALAQTGGRRFLLGT